MYKYFTEKELVCRHCNKTGMDDEFMQKVDTLREKMVLASLLTLLTVVRITP